ncbi:uncharacterized protein LOC112271992 isoform X2 [Brachypodium distachyon]|uniref:uncharacterized protein LOC112271992 isoform X2 n=1 Tax=Brachypodium distachyon TaxID=15368 RepID=UPI000D0CE8DF|nr:uncharacterized protein LOC112271992 isoform X2 [Brachypodium distachyon]|eukprot:XP_024318134.1 uncharacterized protein LOC112271992 isoform X2 [Brachypodium distachyon]
MTPLLLSGGASSYSRGGHPMGAYGRLVSLEIQDCGFVHWVDPEWPNPMKKRLLHLWSNHEMGQNCQREIEKAGMMDAERRKAMEEKMKAEQLFFKAVEDKNIAEFALRKAEEERKKAEEMKMQLELQLADIETESKLKVKWLRQLVLQKERCLMYVGGVVLLLLGFVLAVVVEKNYV